MSRTATLLPAAPQGQGDEAPDHGFLTSSRRLDVPPSGTWRRIVVAAVPAVLYLAVRALGTLMFWGMAVLRDRPFKFRPWDAEWYLRIAEHGYAQAGEGMTDTVGVASPHGAKAFFPGYPLLVRFLAPVVGDSFVAAGLVVSTVAGIAAAYGVARLTRHFGGNRRAELLAIALVAGAPMSVVYTLPYPTALLVAVSVWILVAVLERRWWLASPLVVAAGLVNPMAVPLILVVMAAAVVDLYRRRARWGAVVAAVVSPLGFLGYLLWVYQVSNVRGGYFAITHTGWGNAVDFGAATAKWIFHAFTGSRDAYAVLTAAAILAVGAGLAATWRQMPWQAWLFTAATFVLIVAHSGLVQDRVRLLLSVFPLLIVVAVRLGRAGRRAAIMWTALAVLVGLWFGAYALTVWPYSM